MLVVHSVVQEVQQIAYDDWVVAHIELRTRIRQRRRRNLVAARRAPNAEVYPAGEERFQHTEHLGDLERAIVWQHHTAAAYANALRVCGNLPNEDFRASPREVRQVMVLRHPEAAVAQLLDGARQLDGFRQRVSRRSALPHGGLVHYTELYVAAQYCTLIAIAP